MPAYALPWVPVNDIYFDLPSDTVVVAEEWKSLVCVVNAGNENAFSTGNPL